MELLIVANPCFGLDVKAVAEVRARIMAARNAGTAILLISETWMRSWSSRTGSW